MRKLVIILDPAHGEEVPGKRSPDGLHREYAWSRDIITLIKPILEAKGFKVYISNPTIKEIGLSKRVKFATDLQVEPSERKLLISFHNNAAGSDNKWHSARGVEVYTSEAVTLSDVFSTIALKQLSKDFPSITFRYGGTNPDDLDKDANFTVISGKGYYAILVEWLFQDNHQDVEMLRSRQVNMAFVDSMVKAIETMDNYIS